jgi:hypothetical protein
MQTQRETDSPQTWEEVDMEHLAEVIQHLEELVESKPLSRGRLTCRMILTIMLNLCED